MSRVAAILITCLLIAVHAFGQNYYPITHLSGSQVIGNINVSISTVRSPGFYLGGYCGAGPYHIGNGTPQSSLSNSGYIYNFSRAVREVRFQITASEPGEEIAFVVNGAYYPLTTANISNYTGSCGNNGNSALSSNGTLIFTAGGNNNTTIRIGDSITSVIITARDTIAGSVYSAHFVMDTAVVMAQIEDTVYCAGDTLEIPYTATGTFDASNRFVFQLSDKFGSFASPTVLASILGTTSGICTLVIPAVPSGDKYRIRVASTNPVFVTPPNKKNLAIGNMPIGQIYNTGPACQGSYAQLGYRNYSHFTEVRWSRQGYPAFSKLQYHTFLAVKLSDSGLYVGEMQDYGCLVYDTTRLGVRPNPLVAVAGNNSPICMGDTLRLVSNIDSPTAVNVWVHPDGNTTDTITRYSLPNMSFSDTGKYILLSYYDGCIAYDTTRVQLKHKPITGLQDVNTCFGDSLRLYITDTKPNISCLWKTPTGNSMTVRDTTLKPATQSMNGTYTVTASLDGCATTDTMQVLIKALPPVPYAWQDTTLCTGQTIRLGVNNTASDVLYKWNGPAGYSANGIMPVVDNATLNATGIYTVLADRNGCVLTDSMKVQMVLSPAIPQITSNSPVRIGGNLLLQLLNKEDGVSYNWKGADDFQSTLLNPEIINVLPKHTGTYTLLAQRQQCIASGILQVNVYEGLDTGFIQLYPSPNNGNFYIKALFKTDQRIAIRIINAAGQEVFNTATPTINKLLHLYVPLAGTLSGGVYQLQLQADGQIHTLRFVVSRQ